jgi:tRNA(Ile)-lysidine synthase
MTEWTPLHAQVHRLLRSRLLLPPHSRILIAVSGGQDSLCLAKLLLDLQPKWHWEIAIAHCDHRWRADSQENADYVQQLAQAWHVPFYGQIATGDILSEAAARQWRYQALAQVATQHHFPFITTGHTASDRAETLLYNLIRGAGADGLQALTWKRSLDAGIELVRPLLEVSRSQTGQFCQAFNLKIWEDSTNEDRRYARNRIRHELLPYLQQHFNPQVEQALAQTAELLRADVQYLEERAAALLETALSANHDPLMLQRRLLQAAPLALQRRVMRRLLEQHLNIAPNFEQIEKLTALIAAPNRSRTDPFPRGIIAEVAGEMIIFRSLITE